MNYWSLKTASKTKKISIGANFRKEVQSLDGYMLGMVNCEKLKVSGFSFHRTRIRITKEGHHGNFWKIRLFDME